MGDIASDIVVDTNRHRNMIAYVSCLADEDTIVLCNNKRWFDEDDQMELAVEAIAHETIHILCLSVAKADKMTLPERDGMWYGLDRKFKKLGGRSMNEGDITHHGISNVDKYLK